MSKKGLLLVNLGSPDSASVKDVRKYLDEFLMDERVIDIPYWKRFLLIKGIVLKSRPKKSAEAYKKIWTKEGSPLIILSEKFAKKVSLNIDMPVALGMRYGSMSIKNAIQELHNQGVDNILLLPLYPHHAMSSVDTVVVKAKEIVKKYFSNISIDVFPAFYNRKEYIEAMIENIKDHLKNYSYDHILFSYHGLPERQILKSDPTNFHCKIDKSCCDKASIAHKTCYRHQCFETTKLIVDELGLKKGMYTNSFQSRMLKDPWLKPYTDFELMNLPKQNVKKLVVITPAFVTDCLETLEEIAMEGKSEFLEAGGQEFKYVPCMNDNDAWVAATCKWVENWKKNGLKN